MKNNYNRMVSCMLLAAALGFIITMWAQSGLGQDATGTQDVWAKYQIVLQRNIFSRRRGPIRQMERDEQPRRVVMPDPESYLLLKGIVQENDTFIGFIEDTRGGEILRVHKGDSMARGVIKALSLDSIEYQLEDRTITVTIGHDLQGGQGAVTMTQLYELSQTSPTTSQEGTTQPSSSSEDDADILRQLMERRQQQLGQ